MEVLNGGVTVQEYCATLKVIIDNGGGTSDSEFWYTFWNCSYWNGQNE